MTARLRFTTLFLAGALTALPAVSQAAATIVILNGNGPNVGFNDPTPAAPVGGNPGTTLGQQRLNAFQHAAQIWGASLNSQTVIVVLSTMEPLSCNATSAVLGSAGPRSVWRDFTGAPFAATWYHAALANALFGSDLDGGTDYEIRARFNSNLGQTGCLTGVPFYLGLDNNHGPAVDLVAVLLHEFGHGLGFSTTTSGTSGNQLNDGTNATGYPSAYDRFLFDNTACRVGAECAARGVDRSERERGRPQRAPAWNRATQGVGTSKPRWHVLGGHRHLRSTVEPWRIER
jgi:hypothetical protein